MNKQKTNNTENLMMISENQFNVLVLNALKPMQFYASDSAAATRDQDNHNCGLRRKMLVS